MRRVLVDQKEEFAIYFCSLNGYVEFHYMDSIRTSGENEIAFALLRKYLDFMIESEDMHKILNYNLRQLCGLYQETHVYCSRS